MKVLKGILVQTIFLGPAYYLMASWYGWMGVALLLYVDIVSSGIATYKDA